MRAFASRLWHQLIRYALKFGVVGLCGLAIDVGAFNLLRLGVFGSDAFVSTPLGANIVSVALSTVATWFGNRLWTFREHRRSNQILEFVEFTIVAAAGLGVSMLCLYISHYVLGFDNLVADNIAKNVIGLGLGTALRFLLYRFWVYGHHRSDGLAAKKRKAEAAAVAIFTDEAEANRIASR